MPFLNDTQIKLIMCIFIALNLHELTDCKADLKMKQGN